MKITRVLALVAPLLFAAPTMAATCSGGADCHACTNCSGCRNCARDGGACSVCRPDLYRATSGASRKRSASTRKVTPRLLQARTTQKTAREYSQRRAATPQIVFVGRVIGVTDGDTLTVLHNGAPEKIRLYGIDAPEKKQPFGAVAKNYASTRAFGKTVRVRVVGLDHYKRSIGVVELPGGTVLNVEMVRVGLAWHYKQYAPREVLLSSFERQARAARVGLWRDASPIEPAKWRRKR